MAGWMAERVTPGADLAVVPVPIHWRRMLKRRFNQSALLAQAIARTLGAEYLPDALVRTRHTPPQEGLTRDERFRLQADTIAPHPRRGHALAGRGVLLVDDVMTSGATLAAAARAAGAARDTQTAIFARVVKD
jgi:predicted amidophosphoribosyltransferase